MIISLNGWPGVGKLTIGLELADLLGARLLDNHSMFNVAIALTDYPSPAYYAAVSTVRDIAFDYARALPPGTPLILTGVNATGGPSGFAENHWRAIRTSRMTGACRCCPSRSNVRRESGRVAWRNPDGAPAGSCATRQSWSG